jgi:c-di-GMP-binding flagellar brake protein YcgR
LVLVSNAGKEQKSHVTCASAACSKHRVTLGFVCRTAAFNAGIVMVDDEDRFEFVNARASAQNRRAAFRLPLALDVHVQVCPGTRGSQTWESGRQGPCLKTVTEDLSVGGLRFRAPERLERDTLLELELALEGTRLALTGTVAQTTVDSFGARVGVKFTNVVGQPAQSQISRFLFERERRRLPRVSVMYSVRCSVDGTEGIVDGTTQECSPGFAWLLLTKPTEAGRRVLVKVRIDKKELAMRGRTVSSVKIEDLWRTGVEFDDIVPRWREVIIERRDGRR